MKGRGDGKIYRIYFDYNCISFSDDVPYIINCFDSSNMEIEFSDDEHYRCAGSNPHYLD